MTDSREADAARNLLETFSRTGFKYPRAQARVEAVERGFPNVKFDRHHDGSVVNFGLPEQAMGTVSGNPFYYKFSDDDAELRVWPSDVDGCPLTAADVPTFSVEPILVARLSDVTGRDMASEMDTETGVRVLSELFSSLHAPEGDESPAVRRVAFQEKYSQVVFGSALAEPILKRIPGASLVDLGARMDNAGDAFVRLPSGATLHLYHGVNYVDGVHFEVHGRLFGAGSRFCAGDEAGMGGRSSLPRNPTPEQINTTITNLISDLNDNYTYQQFTSHLPATAARLARQHAVIAACNELRAAFDLPPLSTATVKAMEARSTEDDMDIMRRLRNDG